MIENPTKNISLKKSFTFYTSKASVASFTESTNFVIFNINIQNSLALLKDEINETSFDNFYPFLLYSA